VGGLQPGSPPPPIVGALLIHYNLSYPPYLQAVSWNSNFRMRHAVTTGTHRAVCVRLATCVCHAVLTPGSEQHNVWMYLVTHVAAVHLTVRHLKYKIVITFIDLTDKGGG
jgi:hypothetical protein